MDFNTLVNKRATVKKYSSKIPDPELITEAIETANLAFTHGNLQILKYIMVEDPETKSKIADAAQQDYIKYAPYIIIVCSDKKLVTKMFDIRTDKYIKHHAGAAVENLLLKIVDLGLAASWVGAFSEITIKNTLNIPDNIDIEIIVTIGYELRKKKKQSERKPLINRLFFEQWGNKFYEPITKIRREDI